MQKRSRGKTELVINSYQKAVRWVLKVDVVEGLFIEEMGYSGMTLSALEDQIEGTYGSSFPFVVVVHGFVITHLMFVM